MMAMSMSGPMAGVLSPTSGPFPLQPMAPTSSMFDAAMGMGQGMGGYGQDFGVPTPAGRRRVRIALKSLPGEGREGGEWEVQMC